MKKLICEWRQRGGWNKEVHLTRRLAEELGIYARRTSVWVFVSTFRNRVVGNILFGWPRGWLKYPVHNEVSVQQAISLFVRVARLEWRRYLDKYPYLKDEPRV